MSEVSHFLALAQLTCSVMAYFYPLTLLLVAAWLWVFAAAKPGPGYGRWRMFWLGCAPPFVVPVAVLLCGVVWEYSPASGRAALSYPGYIVMALLLANFPLGGWLAWRWGGRWPMAIASSVLAGYVSLCAAFISTMSISGYWL